jgi:hypothetical protein
MTLGRGAVAVATAGRRVITRCLKRRAASKLETIVDTGSPCGLADVITLGRRRADPFENRTEQLRCKTQMTRRQVRGFMRPYLGG